MNYVIRTESGVVGGIGSVRRRATGSTNIFPDAPLQISSGILLCAKLCAPVSPTHFTSWAPPRPGCGPTSGIRSSALLRRLDSGGPPLYL